MSVTWTQMTGEERRDAMRRTDAGNARRLAQLVRNRYHYVPAWGCWLAWDGRRWMRDTKNTIIEEAKVVARQRITEAIEGDHESSQARREALRWALAQESAGRIHAMEQLARSIPGIPVEPDELDADPWVLNVTSGVLNLRDGKIHSHDPKRLITKLAGDYDPEADAPRWQTFLAQILPDPDVREFMARWIGYCLTGDVSEHKIVFAFGAGANGKSTLLNAVSRAMGDYARQAAPDLLMRRRDEPHPTGLADLHGARLVLASETAQGRHLDEALVKRLTGGDRIKARQMHRDFFEFDPTHKLVVATNHRPAVEGTDHGIWRRIRLVPFTVVIADDDQDHNLDDKLAVEAAGILRWAVAGCIRWQKAGLTEPVAVLSATADYRADMDVIGEFISDRCLLDIGIDASAKDLYAAYGAWSEAMGEPPISQRKFGFALRERGHEKYTNNGVRWRGIALRQPSNGTLASHPDQRTAGQRDLL